MKTKRVGKSLVRTDSESRIRKVGLSKLLNTVVVCDRDLPSDVLDNAQQCGIAALDIETTGLDWRTEQIATCQVYIPDNLICIVRDIDQESRPILDSLIQDKSILKVFHHAMFDLRFMAYHWRISPQNIACTKIASKILTQRGQKHSLKDLVERYLQLELDKSQQTSNWAAFELSESQLSYAAQDVIHLPTLLTLLRKELVEQSMWHIVESSFTYIPTRVQLDILGCEDVFVY